MSRYDMDPDVTWGVRALLDGGVPIGPLADPQRFLKASSGTKLHATEKCTRLKNAYPGTKMIDFTTTAADKFCTTCVDGPTSAAAKAHIRQARLVNAARAALIQVRGRILAGPTGVAPDGDDAHLREAAEDLNAPVTISDPTWELVTQAETVVRMCAEVRDASIVHDDMLTWMAPVDRAAVALHSQLKDAAAKNTDDEALVRTCVLDLMATYTSTSYPSGWNADTPESSNAPLPNPKAYPALCTTGKDFGHRTESGGFENLLNEAWRTWRAEVAATGDLNEGRAAVVRSTRIGDLEPAYVEQLGRGLPVTPPQDNLWDWQVAEWRHHALVELNAVLTLWEQEYLNDLDHARELPDKVVALVEWELKDRSANNASTRVLAQLPVVFHPQVATALTIAPGVVASWLERFDVTGKAGKPRSNGGLRTAETQTVKVLCDTVVTDNADMLSVALRMWEPAEPRDAQGHTYRKAGPMSSLLTAVNIAQGVNA